MNEGKTGWRREQHEGAVNPVSEGKGEGGKAV